MINKIIIFIFIFTINFTYSQKATLNPCSSYTPNAKFDKFVGNWKWQNGNDSFEIVIKKDKIYSPFSSNLECQDILYGFHKLVKNNNIIENSIQNQSIVFNGEKNTFYCAGYFINDYTIKGMIKNSSIKNSFDIELEYIDTNHIKIISIKRKPGIMFYLNNADMPTSDVTNIPQNIILTKQ